MLPSNKTIKEIAEYLDIGMICYLNKKTYEVKFMIDFDDIYADEELWQEDLEEIENNRDSYIRIDKMSSREAFRIMEDFTTQVSNEDIRNRLEYALDRNKPFKNFKYEVDYNEAVRQQWFKFKAYRYEEYVKDFLEHELGKEDTNQIDHSTPGTMQYFYDDGTPYNPDLFPLPQLCFSCKKKEDPTEEILCNLTRMDQQGEDEFKCFAYEKE